MKKAVISNRIYLNRTEELHDYLLNNLVYKIPATRPKAPPIVICDVTRINKDILSIPVGRADLIPSDYEIVDKRIDTEIEFPKFQKTLRESQQKIYNEITDSAIINANAGYGKTFTGIAIATKFSRKTLVLVNTLALRDQWVSEVKKTLNIEAGLIASGICNLDAPIVVGNTQSVIKHIDKIAKEFGLVIIDEVHRMPSDMFKKIVDKLRARYKIGLSATLQRKDGKHVIIKDYISDIILKPDKDENEIKPDIIRIMSEIKLDSNPLIPWATKINKLVNTPEYMDLVIEVALAKASEGYKVLVLSDRVEFLDECYQYTNKSICVIGTTKNRRELLDKVYTDEVDIVYGSISIFKEGIDEPPLSCLILSNPTNNVPMLEQLIGRVTRPYEGKHKSQVIDIVLDGNTARNQANTRLNYYINKGYSVRDI